MNTATTRPPFWIRFTVDPAPATGGTTPPAPAPAPTPAPQTPAGPADTPPAPQDEVLGEPGKAALTAERAARKAAEKATAELAAKVKAFEDRDKTDQEKTAEALRAAQDTAAKATARALRLEVARKVNLPATLDKFLTGDDEETITAQAKELMAAMAPPGPQRPAPDPAQGAKPQTGTAAELDAQIAEAAKAGNVALSISLKRQRAFLASHPKQ